MKIIRYTLLANGKVPSNMVDGGYLIKYNGGESPQDYDMIGLSLGWNGLEEYTTKISFENYVKSFMTDYTEVLTGDIILIQDLIDQFWNRL